MAIVPERTKDPGAWRPRPTLLGSLLVHRYRLTQLIGQGSTGAVYRADDTQTNRPVAVRILTPALSQDLGLISRIRARIDEHARIEQQQPGALVNLVDAFDVGINLEGEVFVVTDYIDGDHLSTMLVRGGRLPWSRARSLLVRLCQLLHGFHGHGLVLGTLQARHCYAVRNRPKHEAIKILNTALIEHTAHTLGPAAGEAGVAIARYASPERLCGEPIDVRADVYSFGAIAYELLTGRVPFVGTNAIRLAAMHLQTPPLPLRQIAPDAGIPAAVEEIVLKTLAKAPADRLATMEAFANALLAVPEGESAAVAPYPGIAPIAAAPAPTPSVPSVSPPVAAPAAPSVPSVSPAPPRFNTSPIPTLTAPTLGPPSATSLPPARRPGSIPVPAAVLPNLRRLSGPTAAAPAEGAPVDRPRETSGSVAAALALPAEAKPAEAKLTETKTEVEAKPAEAKTKPEVEAKPSEAKPADPKPADAKPEVETKPADAKPAEAKPAEPKPEADAKPTETKPEPAKPRLEIVPAAPVPSTSPIAAPPIAADKPSDRPQERPAVTPTLSDRGAARPDFATNPLNRPPVAAPQAAAPAPKNLTIPDDDEPPAPRRSGPEVAPDELRAAALRQATGRHASLSQVNDISDSIIAELPRRRVPWVAVVGFGAALAAGAAAYIQTQPAELPAGGRPAVQQPGPTAQPTEVAKLPANVVAVAEPTDPPPADNPVEKLAADPPPADEPPAPSDPPAPTPTDEPETPPKGPAVSATKPSKGSTKPPKEPKKKRGKAVPEEEEEDVFDQLRKHMEAKKAAEDARAAAVAASQPPPTPAPKIDSESANKAKDTLDRARQASGQGNHALAYSLAKQSYGLVKTTEALELMGMSACKAGNADNARSAANQLAGSRRSAIVDACAKNGITL